MDKAVSTFPATSVIERVTGLFERVPYSLIALVARISMAAVFWQSGQTKLDGWHVSDNAIYLFREEYKLPLIDPVIAAHLAACAQHFCPILPVTVLATR